MITLPPTSQRILALDPCHRGIGYIVLDPKLRLADWGVSRFNGDRLDAPRETVTALLTRHRPKQVVVEFANAASSRRGIRAKAALENVLSVADEFGIPVHRYSAAEVKAVFARWRAIKKEARAAALVEQFPVLAIYRPPYRRPWMSEDSRMAIFDALSFAVTHLVLKVEEGDMGTTEPY